MDSVNRKKCNLWIVRNIFVEILIKYLNEQT